MLKRHPVVAFYTVTFALSLFGAWLAFFVFNGSLWAQWIAVSSPALASLLLTALIDGKAGLIWLFSRLVRWRFHWKWYLAIFLLPVLFALGFAFCNALVDGAGLAGGWDSLAKLASGFGIAAPGLLLVAAAEAVLVTGEELGWRGFALERLIQGRGKGFRATFMPSVIVGFLWGIWHIPSALDPTAILNKAPLSYSIPLFVLGTIVFSFAYTWLYQNTGGSLLAMCLFHGFYNTLDLFTAVLFPAFYVRFWLYLLVMVVILIPVMAARRSVRARLEPAVKMAS